MPKAFDQRDSAICASKWAIDLPWFPLKIDWVLVIYHASLPGENGLTSPLEEAASLGEGAEPVQFTLRELRRVLFSGASPPCSSLECVLKRPKPCGVFVGFT